MKIVGICGEPGTGKTSLMRALMNELANHWSQGRYGTMDFNLGDNKYIVVGKYTGQYFDGTDALSMSVINDAEAFLRQTQSSVVLFEGDRLFCQRFLLDCLNKTKTCKFIQLFWDVKTCTARREQRLREGINQPMSFLSSRRSKYNNLRKQFPLIEVRMNRDYAEQAALLEEIIRWINV
jgi:thymidylate kinase